MTIRDLLEIINDVPEGITHEEWLNMDVLIPVTEKFDGAFIHPCAEETGIMQLGVEEDSEETRPAFVIVRCGFFREHEGVDPELN